MSLVRFFRRKHWDTERAAELESHLQIETDRNVEAGMSPADARAAAHRKLGNPYRIRETIYEMNTIPLLDTLWRDLRFSLRSLSKRPGFTMVVVLSLALGIGANTAIFSLCDGMVFRPLPVPNPGGLVTIPESRRARHHRYRSITLDQLRSFLLPGLGRPLHP